MISHEKKKKKKKFFIPPAWLGTGQAIPCFVPINHRSNDLSDLKAKMLVIEAGRKEGYFHS